MLAAGRCGLRWILQHIDCRKIYLPYYVCRVVPDTMRQIGVDIDFYNVNIDLTPKEIPDLKRGEYFLYVNYFGVRNDFSHALCDQLKDSLILDLTQAFFFSDQTSAKTFSSARKFFGVTDGCAVFGIETDQITALPRYDGSVNADYLLLRQDGKLADGYAKFQKHGASFNELKRVSRLTERIMQRIDFHAVAKRREENFSILHHVLGEQNMLKAIAPCPALCYPFLCENGCRLKKMLCEKKIFIPTYWPELLKNDQLTPDERLLVNDLVCLPIDQRYDADDMKYILGYIQRFL